MNRGIEDTEDDLIEQDLDAREMWDASSKECKYTITDRVLHFGIDTDNALKAARRNALAPLVDHIVNDSSLWQLEVGPDAGSFTTRFTGMVLDQREFFRIAEQGARKKRYNINIDEFVREMETEIVDSVAYSAPEVVNHRTEARVGVAGGGVTVPPTSHPPVFSDRNLTSQFRRPFRLQNGFALWHRS